MQDAKAMKPRLLLVEDDPASRAFMAAVIAALPAEVDTAASIGAALALATDRDYALWLFDVRLPDGSGVDLLARLRGQGRSTPALAHTASPDPEEHAALEQAGFLTTLIKPFTAAQLRETITGVLERVVEPATEKATGRMQALWDERGALAAMNGNHAHVAALRTLFLAELPQQRQAVLAALARDDIDAARDVLHRLKAACGFVGALPLRVAVERLDAAPDDPARADEFLRVVDRILAES